MKHLVISIGLFLLLCHSTALAAERKWSKLEEALSRWEGAKEVSLRTDAADPFASKTLQDLLQMLISRDFTVRVLPVSMSVEQGLTLDHRAADGSYLLVLSSATDGTILTMERIGTADPGSDKPKQTLPPPVPIRRSPPSPGTELPAPGPFRAPFELPGHPRKLVHLEGATEGDLLIGLLYDERLETVRMTAQGLETVNFCSPPIDASRALHLDLFDRGENGGSKLAAVWAEELQNIDQGTDARVHAWIMVPEGRGGDCRRSEDLSGYVRHVGDGLFWQAKGVHRPFTGPIFSLEHSGEFRPDFRVPWAGQSLYSATPISTDRALAWTEAGKLQLVNRGTGEPVHGGTLLTDLGPFSGPAVASRLESPEFRSGFARADRVTETYHPLARRVVLKGEGVAYTISRNRSEGLPVFGAPKGKDSVVRIVVQNDRLRLERPFPEVAAFILDFALIEGGSEDPRAVLLLNEKEDGSGQAYLLRQGGI